jgi:hypothetical protein
MRTEVNPLSTATAATDPGTYRMAPAITSPAEKTAAVTRVRYLERELFDDDGHIRRGVKPNRATEMVASINALRHALGWLEIDLDGRWRWPGN